MSSMTKYTRAIDKLSRGHGFQTQSNRVKHIILKIINTKISMIGIDARNKADGYMLLGTLKDFTFTRELYHFTCYFQI